MREGIGKSDIEGKDWFNVFDEVSEIVTMKDADLRYLWANRSFENLYKLSLKEIVGKTDAEL
ncbi:MAG: PAS domain-containing protein, partial [Candidatus Marinimicrobia bacterium]|nr:PAS domain-containing protein [Candidatus Neomarinimicrobiota bacterium]